MDIAASKISVIVCTYNPEDVIFRRCLDCISAAARVQAVHEILIVDNNSTDNIASKEYTQTFTKDHNQAKVLKESKQGLTPARIKGITESTGDLLIFVDDDNFIDSDYFKTAAAIAINHSFIGAFSGRVTLESNTEPEEWTKKYWGMLIHRELKENVWSNLPFNNDTMPNGAGLCITRDVANQYVNLFSSGKRNFNLDRSKGSLMSGGDNDLAMCACDIGKGMGLFKDLHLKHHIPANRFSLEYLSRLAYGIYYSYAMLLYMRTGTIDSNTITQRIKHLVRISLMKRRDRIIQRSCRRGLNDAIKLIDSKGGRL